MRVPLYLDSVLDVKVPFYFDSILELLIPLYFDSVIDVRVPFYLDSVLKVKALFFSVPSSNCASVLNVRFPFYLDSVLDLESPIIFRFHPQIALPTLLRFRYRPARPILFRPVPLNFGSVLVMRVLFYLDSVLGVKAPICSDAILELRFRHRRARPILFRPVPFYKFLIHGQG